MAAITKRGKTWQARMSYKDKDGNFKIKTTGGFKTKREANEFANQFEVDRATGNLITDETPLFKNYFGDWFETYKESSVRERTRLTYVQAHNVLKKYLPMTKLEDLDRRSYQLFIKEYGKEHAKSTVSKMNSLFHASVKDAIYDELIRKDFIENVSLVFDKKRTRKIEYLNEAQLQTLLDYLLKTRNKNFTSKYMIITALMTGMRPGEIQGLRWQDINPLFNTIQVNQSWNETNQDFQDLKNESSHRTIRIDRWLIEMLSEIPKRGNQGLVFVNQYETIPTSSAINKTLRASLKANKIVLEGFHFHSCRHTHVAYLLAHGIDLYAISKRLGHSNITITANVYSYLIDEYKAKTDDQIIKSLSKLRDPAVKNPCKVKNNFARVLRTDRRNVAISRLSNPVLSFLKQ